MFAFLEDTDITSDQSSLHYLLALNRPLDPQDMAEAQESIKAKVNAIRKKLIQQVLRLAGSTLTFTSHLTEAVEFVHILKFALYLRRERFNRLSSL